MTIQTGYSGPKRTLLERALAAARLDSGAFEEVEADTTATAQAALIVLVSAVAQGVASYHRGLDHVLISICAGLVGWVIWSGVTYIVGSTIFKGTANMGELLRTLGFAQATGILYILALVPGARWLTPLVSLWILVAGIIAIRQALDIDTWKAIVTAIIGWFILVLPFFLLGGAAALVLKH